MILVLSWICFEQNISPEVPSDTVASSEALFVSSGTIVVAIVDSSAAILNAVIATGSTSVFSCVALGGGSAFIAGADDAIVLVAVATVAGTLSATFVVGFLVFLLQRCGINPFVH